MPIRVVEKNSKDRIKRAKPQSGMAKQQQSNMAQDFKGSKKADEPQSPRERMNEKKAKQREQRIMLKEYGMKKGGLKGNQKKLDKNNNNRIDAQDFKILKAEKAKGRGMGLQDEKMKPGKVMEAKRGKFAKTKRQKFADEFSTYNKMRDMMDTQRKMQQRKKDMEKDKQKISEKKKGIAVKSGGMMKYNKGGGADTGKIGELKSKLAVGSDKMKRINEMLKKIGQRKPPKRPKLKVPKRGPMIPLKAKAGDVVNDPRTRDQRVRDAFPKKSPRGIGVISTIGSQNPMKRDRLLEGAKARRRKMITNALKKLRDAGRSLTPAGAAGPIARKIGKKISKKMGGGMMMKPMGYKSGTSVMARGCKLGRKKATKIM